MIEARVHTISLTSPPDDVDRVHRFLEGVWAETPAIETMVRFSFETALIELAANILKHADAGDGLECVVRVETGATRIAAVLTDSGLTGDISLDEAQSPAELEESGRGILLVKALVDELSYERRDGLNRWSILKRLEP